ncbi:uncharacterized protein SPPG_08233 [Spizellomyces punctatus DAOM BR117]|uniref:Uncharacterized protein n=1 Tax=Spizellomyces punctatus (strain DAOM BR117) TaxID=645134 RepID=A0A0L0H4A8_SPIPD|nr:uncharacterized protein SPPG_08233 [Spizellomyces punctatus DAOM BR117]KNC96330.1 hypothetical protein SPPG_08233 [Spizellomyces punctatus DAOM BR117]|eukprot:XP_016604370.1 hypothetical protein SPPG_08233 [Spizellomyces punctatus DAOM BR117]
MVHLGFYALVATAAACLVDGHAILVDPKPRAGQGLAPGPKFGNFPPTAEQLAGCANSTAGPISKTLTAGQNIDVKWAVTIPHVSAPGVRLAIQWAPGQAFQVLANGLDVSKNGSSVALPAGKTSNAAVLQWMWASQEDGGFYLECSDVAVKALQDGPGAPGPGAPGPGAPGPGKTAVPPPPTRAPLPPPATPGPPGPPGPLPTQGGPIPLPPPQAPKQTQAPTPGPGPKAEPPASKTTTKTKTHGANKTAAATKSPNPPVSGSDNVAPIKAATAVLAAAAAAAMALL